MSDFKKFLNEKIQNLEPVFFDGGMGTMIQKIPGLSYSIPEELNFYNPEKIKEIHRKYILAGSNVCTSNTFGANPIKLEKSSHSAKEFIEAGIRLVKEAIEECKKNSPHIQCFTAWDSGQIGKLLEPNGTLTFDEAYNSFSQAAIAAEKAGADLAIIETMSDLYETKAAVLAVKENTNLPIVASMTFQQNLRTLTGADVLTCVTYLESLHVDILGFNCGGSLEEDLELARQFCRYSSTPVLSQPNAGLPEVVNGKDVFRVTPQEFSAAQEEILNSGASIFGGCCGTTPEHIKAMVEKFSAKKLKKPEEKFSTFICSYNKSVQAGQNAGPVIIGERINPTGKKKCREALQNEDMQFIISEADSQINSGAHILDVNTGLPGIDEAKMMLKAVKSIQTVFNTPLQIDSSEPNVLEKTLRYYNGKALVNSVNGKQEVMDKVFPLIKKYGGAVVALCLDENGISPTAEGRVKVAEKIIQEAESYGIFPRDIFIDTLTLTVSSEQKAALETIKAIRILKQKFGSRGLQFVLGVSNISFGLPRRDIINSRFLMLALEAGLSAAIINPASIPMMETYRAYRALAGFDENCIEYIQQFTGTLDPTTEKARQKILEDAVHSGALPSPSPENHSNEKKSDTKDEHKAPQKNPDEEELILIIEKGFKDKASQATAKLLEKKQPVEIIDNCIVPALDSVGKDFETGKKFLPQLLLSAETVSNSFAKIKETLSASGQKQEEKGTVAIATVFGDIHDIGKNIVRAMLENYGYNVIDLGKNVPAETIVKTVVENKIRLVGLSALMTTTVANMEETIKQLHAAISEYGLECKIVVGGAVLTPEYAKKIGADFYAKDAMETVAAAKEVFGK
ncbi:homocysteine S-methyltransferase family protein [Treponema sp.]|uniref:homocysteine S-methyltransferase family protein n=1 Tax=Treponema sp. TaxID=166 RepID=UPI003F06B827